MQGTILRALGGVYRVGTERGMLECVLRGRLRQRRVDDIAVIGDQVEVEDLGGGQGAIVAVLPRERTLSRQRPDGHDQGHAHEDVIVANIHQVIVVFACERPRPNPRAIDRFLVLAEQRGLEIVLVANKADLLGEPERRALFGVYERVGYRVLFTSIHEPATIAPLRAVLAGRISALVGPSGVGKSSLLNAVQPGLKLRTGAVSAALNKGRHTTVAAELLPLDGGGYVADTPGIRELGLWQLSNGELAWCFPELRPLLGSCAFSSCTHLQEPGCAIRAAVERGEVEVERYESYVRLRESDKEATRTQGTGEREPETGEREKRGSGRRARVEWDEAEEDDAPEFEVMRARKGHAPKEAEQRARSRAFGRMAKEIFKEKQRRHG
jgi:ribosome biogenesis GTPase / thiamine phosphate phosphatase